MGNCEIRSVFGHLERMELMVKHTQAANLRAAWVLFFHLIFMFSEWLI